MIAKPYPADTPNFNKGIGTGSNAIVSRIVLLLLLFSATSVSSGHTQEDRPFTLTRVIGHKDGLSGDKIQAIVRDSAGTLWVGTSNGLDRIYGDKINHFSQKELLNKEINFIVYDKTGNIWVSASQNLLLYDLYSDSFKNISAGDLETVKAISYDTIPSGIIFNTYNGIIKYDYASRKVIHIKPALQSAMVYNGFKMLDDTCAVATTSSGDVYTVDIYSGKRKELHSFSRYSHIKAICIDRQGRIWIAIYGRGLVCLSPENGHIVKYFSTDNSFLKGKIILSMKYDNGKLWISTDGNGVLIMDTRSFTVTSLENYIEVKIPQEAECVNTFMKDSSDLWLGTVHHGLIRLRPGYIQCLSGDDFGSIHDRGANRDVVSCLCEDSQGKIWIGTDGGGLYSYDPVTRKLAPEKEVAKEKIVSIASIGDGRLLLSIYNKGVFKYDTLTGKTVPLTIISPGINNYILSQDISISLKRHTDDKVYIACRQLYEYDIRTGKIEDAGINLSGVNSLDITYVDSLCTILSTHYEIYRVNNRNGTVERLLYSKNGDIINVVHNSGKLFMLRSNVLAALDLNTSECMELPFRYNHQLLPVIAVDREENLWLATRNKLIRLEGTSTERYTVFDRSDGYEPAALSEGVQFMSNNGELYFGGHTGLCIVDTENIHADMSRKHISLLAVNVDRQNIQYNLDNRTGTPSINIPWNYNSMYFDISAGNNNIFKANTFRYTINGHGKHTAVYSGSRLSLPVLSPGKYSIDIAYSDQSDRWIDKENAISLSITPPWWKNIVFIGGIIIIIIGGAALTIYLYHRNEKIKAARIYRQRKEKLFESKLRFLTNISHELRTPLTLIYSPLKRLLEKNRFSEPVRSELTGIMSQSRYMSQLIDMVLDSRKLEEGYGKLNISPHDLNKWVKSVADEFRTEYDGKGISLSCDTDPKIGQVNFDEGKFRIILSNLIMNAWKYSDPGSDVTLKTSRHGNNIRISVIDHGIGISGMDTDSLFNRFSQGHKQSKGFGLGLSYTKLLAEAHPGGHIGASANPDKGSTFWFEIPQDIPCGSGLAVSGSDIAIPESDTELVQGDAKSLDFDTSPYTLLIAEDEPNLLRFMQKELRESFREIYTAADGTEAMETICTKQPNIIVSDVMMPKMNGYDLCRNIKNNIEISHIPVILLTAQAGSAHRKEGYKSGADIFLTKPFDIPVLLSAIRNTLYGRHLVREKYRDIFSTVSAAADTFSNADEQFLLKLDRFIADNISDDSLDAQMIISHMCMGRATFYKKIKEVTGIGIMEYVTGKRMKLAGEMLRTTALPINEIALRVGYADSRYFSRVFKQAYSTTPSAWREQHGSGPDSPGTAGCSTDT